ncbi:hypothetical protein GC170_22455 [bacterium]|nr:hypothetical protein [bacterium]
MSLFDDFEIEDLLKPIKDSKRPNDVLGIGVCSGEAFDLKFNEIMDMERALLSMGSDHGKKPPDGNGTNSEGDRDSEIWKLEKSFALEYTWMDLYKRCRTYLKDVGKDLRIAFCLAESMISAGSDRGYGAEGLKLGLEMLASFIERYRETGYPRPDAEHPDELNWADVYDQWSRTKMIRVGTNRKGVSPFSLCVLKMKFIGNQEVPDSMLSYLQWQTINDIERTEILSKVDVQNLRHIDSILSECQDLADGLKLMDADNGLLYDLKDCISWIRKVTEVPEQDKSDQDQTVVAQGYASPSDQRDTTRDSSVDDELDDQVEQNSLGNKSESDGFSGNDIVDIDSALKAIAKAAEFLRNDNPDNPTAYLISRCVAMGRFYNEMGLSTDANCKNFVTPETSVRVSLNQKSKNSEWDSLIEESEATMFEPAAAGWLDLHRLADTALQESGRTISQRATRAFFKAWLAEFPKWPKAIFMDETSCASITTQEWLRRNFVSNGNHDKKTEREPVKSEASPVEVSAYQMAQSSLRDGNWEKSLEIMVMAIRKAENGRDRFMRRLELAELLLQKEEPERAFAILSQLYAEFKTHDLMLWEDNSLISRLLSAVYRSVTDPDLPIAREVMARLMSVDPIEAMRTSNDLT